MRKSRPQTQLTILGVFVALGLVLTAPALGQPDDRLISPNGVGRAMLGSTVDELRDQLGDDYEVGALTRIIVDFNGHVVRHNGRIQFRVVQADAPVSERLTLFIVSNPEYRTAHGVGPGMTIAEAAAIYGNATLTWDPENESREFVSFENQPDARIRFRTPGIGGHNVGVYGAGKFETNEYEVAATIASAWVDCGSQCPTASTPHPTATAEPTPIPNAEATVTATPEPTTTATAEATVTATPEPTTTATAEATVTATPEPTTTATAEATVTATPEPTTPQSASAEETAQDDDLPNTGFEHNYLIAGVSSLLLAGVALVLIEARCGRDLGPRWLGTKP